MKVVGLTGGIGSGKTTVARFFEDLGVPVFITDTEAKKIMEDSVSIKEDIIASFGVESYKNGKPDRPFLAAIVFKDKKQLEVLNGIIHPAVAKKFEEWKKKQSSPYVIYESAILFEKGNYKNCDFTILVTAPREVRIQRVLERDKTTVPLIEERMDKQWADERKMVLADFVIQNLELDVVKKEVGKLHKYLSQLG